MKLIKRSKRLVFAGAGHAHLTAVSKTDVLIKKGHEVIVISSPFHYYSGMGPGMLSGIYEPRDLRFNIEKLVRTKGGVFYDDKVIKINPANKMLLLRSGRKIDYSLASFNIGSNVTKITNTKANNIFYVKPIEELYEARSGIIDKLKDGPARIAVVGGGTAGVEISNNVWRLIHDNKGSGEISLISREEILSKYDPKVRRLALKKSEQKGITVLENISVSGIKDNKIRLADGKEIEFDFAFIATGVKPPSLFKDSGMLTGEDGGLLVNEYMQSVEYPEIFGGGDCVHFEKSPLDKVGVYAVRQNMLLYNNLQRAMEGGNLTGFRPQKKYMLILNMGDRTGIFLKKSLVWNGRKAFILKDYIDRKFVRKFQLSGESGEA